MGAVAQIYEYVTSRTLPPDNITSEAIRAYYPGADVRTVKSWACQVLCMISEYHMACVTQVHRSLALFSLRSSMNSCLLHQGMPALRTGLATLMYESEITGLRHSG